MIRALALCLALAPAGALADCRQALALGLDVSGSVDSQDYRLQLEGLAGALQDPTVRSALLSQPDSHVEVFVYTWSGPDHQRIVLDWTEITAPAALDQAAQQLRQTQRIKSDPSTAIGAAMAFGAAALHSRVACPLKVLDISGDGPANTGPLPQNMRNQGLLGGIIVNGLVIPSLDPVEGDRRTGGALALDDYYRAYVIHGPGAFTEMALGYQDYQDAMTRKLIRELQGLVLSHARDLRPVLQ
ncbi:MAG: DUF1194 domain-containing protein [Thalassovita sp.]